MIKEVPLEIKVPVVIPCVTDKPGGVTALRLRVGLAEWGALSTDQRNNLIGAQALDHKLFGDKLSIAMAGCL